MKIYFVENNFDMYEALKISFKGIEDVEIVYANILDLAQHSIVSPANCFGFMDGGIDKLYVDYFGENIQEKVMQQLNLLGGYLPVGSAFTIDTGDKRIPYLIFAPTMEIPGPVNVQNCYFAMSAILKEISRKASIFKEVYCPGLCTGVGNVDSNQAAHEMLDAFNKWAEK